MSIAFYVVACPCGNAEFPVDPEKVPEEGIHARCSVCSGVFLVERPAVGAGMGATAVLEAPAEEVVESPSEAFDRYFEPVLSGDRLDVTLEGPEADAPAAVDEVAAAPEAPPAPAEPSAEVGIRMEVDLPVAPAGGVVFGRRDPHDKARRLARVLVSDMITYHRDRHARASAAGTLAEDFDEEIRKSWEEYVMQVGRELAEETTYFRDALNEILAGGRELF